MRMERESEKKRQQCGDSSKNGAIELEKKLHSVSMQTHQRRKSACRTRKMRACNSIDSIPGQIACMNISLCAN